MAKPKAPLLSLEAHGSIGDALTFQRSASQDISRAKPRLPYFLTLPVQYQRWLYQDYAYRWRQQSAATQKSYRAAGVRFHLTGYQYWMRDMLTRLPDIVALYHLDETAAGRAADFSRNENHGTIVGASPTAGLVDRALSHDGINDATTFPYIPAFNLTTHLTIEAFVKRAAAGVVHFIAGQDHQAPQQSYLFAVTAANLLRFSTKPDGGWEHFLGTATLGAGWHHAAVTFDASLPAANIKFYLDGAFDVGRVRPGALPPTSTAVQLGKWLAAFYAITLDQVAIYNRVLDATEVARHAARRYPRQ